MTDRRTLATQRGATLVAKVKPWKPGQFIVPSSREGGPRYKVTRIVPVEGFPIYVCTCAAAQHGHICAHTEAARMFFERPVDTEEPVAGTAEPLEDSPSTRSAKYGPRKVQALL